MDLFCAQLEKAKFDSDFIASPPRVFAGDGRALMSIDTDCVNRFDYYTIGLYWSGKKPGCNHFIVRWDIVHSISYPSVFLFIISFLMPSRFSMGDITVT